MPVVLWEQGIKVCFLLVLGGIGIPKPRSQGCQGDPAGSLDVPKENECPKPGRKTIGSEGLENSHNLRFPKVTLAMLLPRTPNKIPMDIH